MKPIKGNVYRELLARAIENNGGYSSGYHDRYALEWNVALDWSVPYADKLRQKGGGLFEMLEENWGVSILQFFEAVPAPRFQEWCDEWDDDENQQRVWGWVQEDMARSVDDGDDDSVRFLSPDTERRYSVKVGEKGFDVAFERVGRSGKHLCLAHFEGYTLKVRNEGMVEALREGSTEYHHYSNVWCQKLLAYIAECDRMFSREAVKKEFEYQVAYRAADELHDLYDECVSAAKEAAEAQYWAERDVVTQ